MGFGCLSTLVDSAAPLHVNRLEQWIKSISGLWVLIVLKTFASDTDEDDLHNNGKLTLKPGLFARFR